MVEYVHRIFLVPVFDPTPFSPFRENWFWHYLLYTLYVCCIYSCSNMIDINGKTVTKRRRYKHIFHHIFLYNILYSSRGYVLRIYIKYIISCIGRRKECECVNWMMMSAIFFHIEMRQIKIVLLIRRWREYAIHCGCASSVRVSSIV